ncbi:MAG TPA: AAA family ATPase, partial [Bacteroidales bacterium]|nr:AAA family ATPase [Bacteroidales bacterium]
MRILYQKFETLLQNTTTGFKRYLYEKVSWDNRLIGIIGARGVGKTTMILQHIKENLDSKKALYVSADDMYFGENRLFDLAD